MGGRIFSVHGLQMPDSLSTRNAPSELFEGAYYSIIDGDEFSIAKVLKLEPEIVHVRIYKQHFPQRPRSIDHPALTLGASIIKSVSAWDICPCGRRLSWTASPSS
jgi:hypothetical protein